MTARIVPLAGVKQWAAVMERAGWRCQCTSCPKHRRQAQGRCETEVPQLSPEFWDIAATPDVAPLIAAPRNPGPDTARNLRVIPVADLRSWCPDCYDRAVAFARKLKRESARFDSPTETLF